MRAIIDGSVRRCFPLLLAGVLLALASCAKQGAMGDVPVPPPHPRAAQLGTELETAARSYEAARTAYRGADRSLLRKIRLRVFGPNEAERAAETKSGESAVAVLERTGREFESNLAAASAALGRVQDLLELDESLRSHGTVFAPLGSASAVPGSLEDAAKQCRAAAANYLDPPAKGATLADPYEPANKALASVFEKAEMAHAQDAWITGDLDVVAVLLLLLALLFGFHATALGTRVLKVVPLLVFAYFVPTVLSNLGLLPVESPVYSFISRILLPASLVLLVLAVDVPAILRLGKHAVILFLVGTGSIVIGGPLAYLALGWMVPDALGEQAWKGLAALSGSWIGGGANFVAIGNSVGANANTISMMVVVDVAVAELWMVVLLFFAGREKAMDEKIGADRGSLDEVRRRIEDYERSVQKPITLPSLLALLTLAFGVTALSTALADQLPAIGSIVSGFTWVVLICTTVALGLSFTRVRSLEGAGASKLGSALLYLLVGSIGARAQFSKVLEVPALVAIGALWMSFHAAAMLLVRRWLKAPIFFAAVGSKANVGGAASAPILASAFHPALAPVGVLLAVGGYVLGTYGGLVCAALLEWVAG